jgi:hypothetical protein
MEEYKVQERAHPLGIGAQRLYRFPNGYGASVVQFMVLVPSWGMHPKRVVEGSKGAEDGLWELALVKFDGINFGLVYEHGYDDVVGHLTDAEVLEHLEKIKSIEVSHG